MCTFINCKYFEEGVGDLTYLEVENGSSETCVQNKMNNVEFDNEGLNSVKKEISNSHDKEEFSFYLINKKGQKSPGCEDFLYFFESHVSEKRICGAKPQSYRVFCKIQPVISSNSQPVGNNQPLETAKEDSAQSVGNSTLLIILICISAVLLVIVVVILAWCLAPATVKVSTRKIIT